MRSIYFTGEHDAFRRAVRKFVTEEVAPHAEEWERNRRIPRGIFPRLGELGFLGILFPEEYGGAGADVFYAIAFLEELPRSLTGGFCASVSVQQFMATQHIYRSGSEELKRRYLVPSIAGRFVGALAITEPDTGSDVAAIRTTALLRDGEYVVNGSKTFITNGAEGDFYTTAVRTGRAEDGAAGISLLVIDVGAPGVKVARRLDKIGWHSSDTAELVFEDARVPAGNLVGAENTGFYQIMESFPLERLSSAAIAVGSGLVCIEKTLEYMAARHAFGKPLNRFQALRHRLADLAAELEAARQLTYHAAWLYEHGQPAVMESSMAKLLATELGKKIADECLQLHGGYGYMEEYMVARFYRDARAATIAAGTSEIMREIISRLMIEGGSPLAETARQAPRAVTEPPRRAEPDIARSECTAESPRTVADFIRAMPQRFRPEKAEGWRTLFHYKISGSASPEWTVQIDGSSCHVTEGLAGQPNCVVEMSESTYLGVETGAVNAQAAFMMGEVKVSDLGEMMRFMKVFRPVAAK
ncbi:MAG: acyl-CoA dehydrogenase family protein [Acidobacteriota bacterium]